LTERPGVLGNDFFVNLLDMSTQWTKSAKEDGIYDCHDRRTCKLKWTATPVGLLFGSHAELRAIAEVYAARDGQEKLVRNFIAAWTKVMSVDRFDTI
jgi:catalase-peroxidase